MKRHVTYVIGSVLIAVVVWGSYLAFADPPVKQQREIDETKVLMRAKLTSSQRVLEGLLVDDYQRIRQGAREMIRISEAAEWPRARDEVYEHYSTELRRQCNKLDDLAAKRNHEGASFTYLHITTTCINCHDYVRDALRVADQPDGGVRLIPAQVPEIR